jgi:hypothetical protein
MTNSMPFCQEVTTFLTSDNARNPVSVGHFSQVLIWAMRDSAEALKRSIPFPDLIHAIAKNMSILGW